MPVPLPLKRFCENENAYFRQGLCYIAEDPPGKAEISLDESFACRGAYIFLDTGFAPDQQFVRQAIDFLSELDRRFSFIWLVNPRDAHKDWYYYLIGRKVDGGESVTLKSSLGFDDYQLCLDDGLKVYCYQENFIFSYPDKSKSFCFSCGGFRCLPYQGNMIVLSAWGENNGSISLSVLADPAGAELFSLLNAGIRFAVPAVGENSGENISLVYNSILMYHEPLPLNISLTPLAMLNPQKTFISLPKVSFISNLITVTGGTVRLSSNGKDAAMVFERRAEKFSESGVLEKTVYALGYSGAFAIEWPPDIDDTKVKLLCGLYGTEYLDLGQLDNPQAVFVPSCESVLGSAACEACTSWLKIVGDGIIKYCHQPETTPLFSRPNSASVLLEPLNVPVKTLTGAVGPFPMMVYGNGRYPGFREARHIESLLENKRFTSAADDLAPVSANGVLGVSPQGLIISINADKWDWIGVAGNEYGLPTVRMAPNPADKEVKLQRCFQQTKAFFYLDSRKELEDIAQFINESYLEAEDWKFQLSGDKWRNGFQDNSNTMMIFKYNKEFSISDKLKEHPVFAKSYEKARQSEDLALYRNFLSFTEDKSFEGILVLNCPVDVSQLNEVFKIILKNVNADKFYAHHIALQNNMFESTPSGPVMDRTRTSAIIDYKNERDVSTGGGEKAFDFETLELKLAVENSVPSFFSSISELMMNRLFESPITAVDNPSGNCLTLAGSMYYKEGQAQYQFLLRESVKFEFALSAISSININQVFLSSSRNAALFELFGAISFAGIDDFDILSYREEKTSGKGLLFSGLKLVSRDDSDEIVDYYDDIFLNYYESVPAALSFAGNFGARPKRLYVSAADSPLDEGFQNVGTPVAQSKITKPWVGLVFGIEAGTLGGLSSGGAQEYDFLAAWSVTEGKLGFFFGIDFKNDFLNRGADFLGLLKLGFKNVSLEGAKDKSGVFELKLNKLALEFLGLSFPNGNASATLFSNGKDIGWYAAYINKD